MNKVLIVIAFIILISTSMAFDFNYSQLLYRLNLSSDQASMIVKTIIQYRLKLVTINKSENEIKKDLIPDTLQGYHPKALFDEFMSVLSDKEKSLNSFKEKILDLLNKKQASLLKEHTKNYLSKLNSYPNYDCLYKALNYYIVPFQTGTSTSICIQTLINSFVIAQLSTVKAYSLLNTLTYKIKKLDDLNFKIENLKQDYKYSLKANTNTEEIKSQLSKCLKDKELIIESLQNSINSILSKNQYDTIFKGYKKALSQKILEDTINDDALLKRLEDYRNP